LKAEESKARIAALVLGVAAYCLLPSGYFLFAASGLYQVREVKPHVFVWVPDDVIDQEADPQFSRAGTAGFIVTGEGVVVIDSTNSPFHGRELLYEIRQRTEAPVRYVVNTDASGEHMLGNEVFVDQRAILISTPEAKEEMLQYRQGLAARLEAEDGWKLQPRVRGFHVTPATQTFQKEMVLRLGGEDIKLLPLLPYGDSAVYLPAAKVLFLGELFENGYYPRIESRDVRRWIETLRQLESWDVEVYVPGHGEPGDKKALGEFRQFLEKLVNDVESRLQQGKTLAQVKQELLADEDHRHAPELAARAVEAVYRQLSESRQELRATH